MKEMEKVAKHLEIIQGIINRLANNSFLLKGWSMALLVGFLIFMSRGSDQNMWAPFGLIIPIFVFWGLDGYFLWKESLYRELYKAICKRKKTDFSMDISNYTSCGILAWLNKVFSSTLIPFYLMELGFAIVVFLILCSGGSK